MVTSSREVSLQLGRDGKVWADTWLRGGKQQAAQGQMASPSSLRKNRPLNTCCASRSVSRSSWVVIRLYGRWSCCLACEFRYASIKTSGSSSSLTTRTFWLTAAGWTEHFLFRY